MPNTTTLIVTGVDLNTPVPRWVRAFERLGRWGAAIAGVVCAIMAVTILADVAGRYFWNHPITGTLEMVTYWWMPAVALLALGAAEIRNEHIRVTILGEGAAPWLRRIIEIVASGLTFAVIVWMCYLAVLELLHSLEVGEKAQIAPWIILWPSRLVVVVAFVLYAFAIIARAYRTVRQLEADPEDIE
ncbi:TRAP transporter small permease subunit [Microbacterium sp. A93]|uniref:TRAP transporter small permease subunit n=1 Tax=Microbacterium sp. A93 TaxID=3450716 RepID=UPI003F4253F5